MKGKWRGLRDNFRKEQAKLSKGRSGDAGSSQTTSKWAYFNMMLFLKNTVANRNTSSNIGLPSPQYREVEDVTLHSDDIFEEADEQRLSNERQSTILQQSISESSSNFRRPPSKKCKRNDNIEKMMALEKEKLQVYRQNTVHNNDAHYQFLVSLLPELKKVPAHRQLHARIRLLQVLLEEQQYQPMSQWIPTTSPSTVTTRPSSTSSSSSFPPYSPIVHSEQDTPEIPVSLPVSTSEYFTNFQSIG